MAQKKIRVDPTPEAHGRDFVNASATPVTLTDLDSKPLDTPLVNGTRAQAVIDQGVIQRLDQLLLIQSNILQILAATARAQNVDIGNLDDAINL